MVAPFSAPPVAAKMPVADQEMFALSHRLAPVYCEEISLEASLTKNITLYQLLGIFSEKDLDLRQRWASSDVTKSMAAPLGVRAGNEIVYLDIHDGDKHHGPHGLVAGTTGSGKSEILMTYILSMITLYSPLTLRLSLSISKAAVWEISLRIYRIRLV